MTEPEPPQSPAGPNPESVSAGSGVYTGGVFARSRPASHRAPLPGMPIVGRVLAPVTAIAVVAATIVLLVLINSSHKSPRGVASAILPSTPSATTQSGGAPSPTPSPKAKATHHPRPSASPSASASASASASGSASASTSASPSASASASSSSAGSAPTVQVLNNSRRTGLAAAVASEVQAKGWTISLVGNLRGAVPVPTVYYSPGDKAAALRLKGEFGSIAEIEPAAELGIKAPGLTLVLTESWSG